MASKYCTCKEAKIHSLPKSKRLFWLSFLACFATLNNVQVLAQIPPLPPETDPSRIQQQLQPPLTPPPQNQEITVPRREELTPPPGAERQKFRLNSLQVEGVTAYKSERIQKLYAAFLGQNISLSDLYQIANRITQLYRQDGFVLSQAIVPEQTIRNGIAKIQVIEGFIERVNFQGAPKLQLNRLTGFGNKIVASRPLNVRSLERYLLLANDLAGIQTRGVLSPGSSVGAAILTVNVVYNATNTFVDVNNRGSAAVGPLRSQVALFLNSLLGTGEQLTLSGATTPINTSELANAGLGVSVPIGYEGLRISLNGAYTNVRPGNDLRKFDINGNTYSASVGVSYPLIRSRATNLSLNGAFDYTNQEVTTSFTETKETLSEDRLRVLRAGLNYSSIDAQGAWEGDIQISQGIGGLGATTEGTASKPLSRAQGSADFTKLNFTVTQSQSLSAGLILQLAGTAQITGNALLVSEQFGLGGDDFGRAFEPSQVLGDSGYALRAELQRQFAYKVGKQQLITQPYIFYDYGQVFRNNSSAAENDQDTLSSIGLGVKQSLSDSLLLQAELGFPLIRTDSSGDRDPRLFFSLRGFF